VRTISFARGIPAPELLPLEEFGECARAIVEADGRTALNYCSPGGYGPLREWIAARHGVAPERVLVTNGSLQAFNLVARHVVAAGARVLVEAPTYDRTIRSLAALGADVDGIPLGQDGLDPDAVADALAAGDPPVLVYTIPTFQNPSGRTLTLSGRERVAALVGDHGLLVYEDDPYGLVRFAGKPLPTLREAAGGEHVIYASSFSKTVAPGIRVGYLVLPERLVAPLEELALETYLSPTTFVQGALFQFLERGRLDTHLERVRAGLRERRDAMVAALRREMPEGARWNEPEGGYFLWLELPPGVRADSLFARAAESGITFVEGSDFFVEGGGEEAARLAFSFAAVAEIEEGIARLGRLVHESAVVAA
jgi:2-aminoadipate transaminase